MLFEEVTQSWRDKKYKIQVTCNKIHKIQTDTGYPQRNTKIQVTRLWGDEIIKTAVVHPAAAAEGCEVELTKSSSLPQ